MALFAIPTHVVFGTEALSQAGAYMKKFGNRALVVTGPHVARSPMICELKKALEKEEIAYMVFDGITGEPTDEMIRQGLEAYKKSHSRFIIGIGGGSPLDAAKAIALMSVQEEDTEIAGFMGEPIYCQVPKIVAIPTTSGTGSEATKFTVITNTKTDVKMLLAGDCLIPDLAVINYEYTMDMPKSVTASTGLDALTHAIESYTSRKASELTDVYAISAVKRIMRNLPIVYNHGNDGVAREQMALAAFEAGVCINNASVTLVHGMSRPIGAIFHVSHGTSNAMLLGECLSFAMDGACERFANLGRACGYAEEGEDDMTAAEKFVAAVREVIKTCEIPTISEYGIDVKAFAKAIPKMAEDAMASGSPGNTRKTICKEDCERIYHKLIS